MPLLLPLFLSTNEDVEVFLTHWLQAVDLETLHVFRHRITEEMAYREASEPLLENS